MGTKVKLAAAMGAVLVLSAVSATSARAQRSNFGTINLTPGFTPDPHEAAGTSGGQSNANRLGSRCRGWISSYPDHILQLTRDFGFLRIFAESSGDTTLVIQTPDGQVRCDDDTYARNPAVEGSFPAGTYRIWVGSYAEGENSRYQLRLTELRNVTPGSGGGASNSGSGGAGDANRGLQIDSTTGNFDAVTLRSGFTPDPAVKTGVSGGQLDAQHLGGDCRGWIAGRPDHILRLQGNFGFFRILVESDSDTTLVVRTPSGRFLCNDDANGLNPAVDRRRWRRGMYRVWVGSYSEGDNSRYRIGFTELSRVDSL